MLGNPANFKCTMIASSMYVARTLCREVPALFCLRPDTFRPSVPVSPSGTISVFAQRPVNSLLVLATGLAATLEGAGWEFRINQGMQHQWTSARTIDMENTHIYTHTHRHICTHTHRPLWSTTSCRLCDAGRWASSPEDEETQKSHSPANRNKITCPPQQ